MKKEPGILMKKDEEEMFVNAGRDIVNFISKSKMSHARRVILLDKEHKFVLTCEDLEKGIEIIKKTKNVDKLDSPPIGMYM